MNYCAECSLCKSTMKHYHGTFIHLYQIQVDAGTSDFTKEKIMSNPTKFLLKNVRIRKARVEQQNCVEKNTYSTYI